MKSQYFKEFADYIQQKICADSSCKKVALQSAVFQLINIHFLLSVLL